MPNNLAPALILTTALLSHTCACVVGPTDDGVVASRLNALTFEGYAGAPEGALQFRAWNYARSAWELVDRKKAGTSPFGSHPPMYRWVADLWLGDRFWGPTGTPCSTPGTARVEVREVRDGAWTPLKTFDAAGKACLGDQLGDGASPLGAGAACATGEDLTLHAPASCVPATSEAPYGSPVGIVDQFLGGPLVVLYATDDERVWNYTQIDESAFIDDDGEFIDVPMVRTVPPGRTLRIRADSRGVVRALSMGELRLTVGVRALCRRVGTTVDVEVGSTYVRTATAPAPTPGPTPWPGTLGVALDLDRAKLQPLCPATTAIRNARLDLSVRLRLSGGEVVSYDHYPTNMDF